MDIIDIAHELERRRQEKNITIDQLCRHACICRATYYHWIEDRTVPKVNMLSSVMDVLGLEIEIVRRKPCR